MDRNYVDPVEKSQSLVAYAVIAHSFVPAMLIAGFGGAGHLGTPAPSSPNAIAV